MLLSSNLPFHELVAQFISDAIPEATQVYAIRRLGNGAISIHTEHGEWENDIPQRLPNFIEKSAAGWYAVSETPFGSATQIVQTSLEMELERDHLFLNGFTLSDVSYSLLIQLRPFGPTKTKYLLAGEKKVLERSLRGVIQQLIRQVEQDKNILQHIAWSNNRSKNEVAEIQKQLDYQSKNFEVAIAQFVQMIVKRLEKKYSIPIRTSRAFVEALKSYNRPFEGLEHTLDQHLYTELNLALVQDEHEIVLAPSHLEPLNSTATPLADKDDEGLNLGRFTKTYKLLTRYEEAAQRAQQKNLRIIGKHIGNHCQPPVSNAAITDALNKHAKKIYDLFQRYPEKWPTIRNEFRSIANIMEKEVQRRQAIA